MPEMAKYSKAYVAEQFRQYPEWSEKTTPAQVSAGDETTAETESVQYFFLHDNYVVTSGVFRDENIAFDSITDEWRDFCHNVLRFNPNGPDDESEESAETEASN
jgi:hypothetical protein